MRITTWNCAAGLSKKPGLLSDLAPDVVVLQEWSRRDAESIGALFLGPDEARAKKGVAIKAFNAAFELVPCP